MITAISRSLFITTASCLLAAASHAQALHETRPDAEEGKLLYGIIRLQDIKQDTSFKWYAQTLQYYKPNTALVAQLKARAGQLHYVLFTGTWCHDSQAITPKYFACMEAAALPESAFTIVATDRDKKAVAGLHSAFGISLVPTLIVMKAGKEVARITEYGSTGLPDAELADILGKLQ
ncbi:MAG: thioredoxin family protein [Chitinophagaceae bacterium]|jgi:thiol-disulfide isomerase/thioredoxin|nr:thioredoxin family protein [Chitinophagaceae bacterium]